MSQNEITLRQGIGMLCMIVCIVNSIAVALHKMFVYEIHTALIIYLISAPIGIWGLWKVVENDKSLIDISSKEETKI